MRIVADRFERPFICALGVVYLLSACSYAFATQPPQHPKNPLTALEYSIVLTALRDARKIDGASRFPLIVLDEPAKVDVLRWKPGAVMPRRAYAIVKKGRDTFEAVVDIPDVRVVSWKRIEGVQPNLLLTDEWVHAGNIVKADPRWQAAIRKRDVLIVEDIVCVPMTVGHFGSVEEQGRRLVKVSCFDSHGIRNFWGRPIEGLVALVDLDERKVVSLIDIGVAPMPSAPVDFDPDSVGEQRKPPNTISLVQPKGPSFKLSGHEVSWQKWNFRYHIDPRLGPVVSMVAYNDDGKMRSVLYEGSLSELFVPYMDPSEAWYFRTYMDAGEYGIGKLAAPLEPGFDCPSNAVFLDAVFADDRGQAYTQERAACLFERYAGGISWRHYDSENRRTEVRKRTDLVLRFIAAVGNYDYVFDWVFRQDGSITVAVGASGIEQVKAVKSATINDGTSSDTAYGHMVAPHTVGINHDHFFCFRIDLDVDGSENSFVVDRLKTQRLEHPSPRKSIWVVDSQKALTEQSARLRINIEKPALWRVINPNVLGPLGYPVSYHLKPGTNAVSLLAADDFPQRRARFTDFHLWVTPYHSKERYAAGKYPNQSKGGDGLPRWTSADRPIQNTDIVLWYTLGFHHVVRPEDWPVLPLGWHSFELRPFDFFQRNPALDLPN